MNANSAPIFAAALALPQSLRADLAAALLQSLDDEHPYVTTGTPDEWLAEVMARSESLHRGEAELIDGQQVADKLQAIVDRAGERS